MECRKGTSLCAFPKHPLLLPLSETDLQGRQYIVLSFLVFLYPTLQKSPVKSSITVLSNIRNNERKKTNSVIQISGTEEQRMELWAKIKHEANGKANKVSFFLLGPLLH